MFIENFPQSGWVNEDAKTIAYALVSAEQSFVNKKAKVTLSSMLITLASVFKEDASQIAIIIARPVNVTPVKAVVEIDPNPGNNTNSGCETCGGGKIVLESFQTPVQSLAVSKTVVNQGISTTDVQTEVDKNITFEEKLVVSKEHKTTGWKNPGAVWKYFSGDVAKLREAAKALGINNIDLDDTKTLSVKIYEKSIKK